MAASSRVFISYRSSDGRDKATALSRELGERFGADQVFLDKDDLRGGSAWRDEVARTLGRQPVLLLLLTPDLLGATGTDGRRRIDDADDPVRRELEAALASGAAVIPVLCDGVEAPPDADSLPAPFARLGEFTWRRLRAYDWSADVSRLFDDLAALGIAPLGGLTSTSTSTSTPARPAARRPRRRAWAVAAIATVALSMLAAGGLYVAGQRSTATSAADLSGLWDATLVRGEPVQLTLTQSGERLSLTSAPVSIAGRPDWADYRAFWRERHGVDLDAVVYRGEGRVFRDPAVAPRIDVALQVTAASGDTVVDGGNLSATVSADGRQLTGTVWLNSAQAQWPATLRRAAASR